MIKKRIIKGGNNQLLVYLPKKYFKLNEVVTIIKELDIINKKIVLEINKGK